MVHGQLFIGEMPRSDRTSVRGSIWCRPLTFVGRLHHIFLKHRIKPVARISLTQYDPPGPLKDDIVGWPNELLIDFPDCTLDSVANTPTPDSARHP
jgi:hypothetical protein